MKPSNVEGSLEPFELSEGPVKTCKAQNQEPRVSQLWSPGLSSRASEQNGPEPLKRQFGLLLEHRVAQGSVPFSVSVGSRVPLGFCSLKVQGAGLHSGFWQVLRLRLILLPGLRSLGASGGFGVGS